MNSIKEKKFIQMCEILKMRPTQKRVLKEIYLNPHRTHKEIAERLNLNETTQKHSVNQLLKTFDVKTKFELRDKVDSLIL